MLYTGAAFDGEEGIRPDATVADLLHLMFEAPDIQGDFIASVLACTGDELEMIEAAAENELMGSVVKRVALRASYRVRIALELDRRMRQAAEAGGGVSCQ